MKILVFDDNMTHRAAAEAQLNKHDLTVVGTYDEAQELLEPKINHERVSATLKKKFGEYNPYIYGSKKDKVREGKYLKEKKVAIEQATTYPNFDVVLSDLLVPASKQAQGSMKLVGMEMPVGIFIGLLAAAKGHVKYVAIFTDSDHHSHPASACFDAFNKDECEPTPFTVEGSKVLLSNTRKWISTYDKKDLSRELKGTEGDNRPNTVKAKNWSELLAYLLK